MRRRRHAWGLLVLVLVLLLLYLRPAGADPPQHVAIVVVGSHSIPRVEAMARNLEATFQLNVTREGLADRVQVIRYDFDVDADRQHCLMLHVDSGDLPYVGVVDMPSTVMFHVTNVVDLERGAKAGLEAMRGVVSPSQVSQTAVGETPAMERHNVVLYRYWMRHPSAAGHPDVQTVANVMQMIRTRFVDVVTDRQMEEGMVLQVRDLLLAASVSRDALAHMTLDADLPTHIQAAYGSVVPPELLALAEVRGTIMPLNDPFSAYLPPDQAHFMTLTLGDPALECLGIHLAVDKQRPDEIVVVDVLAGSSAADGNVQPGDVVVKVDGQSVEGRPVDVVSSMMGGAAGSSVVVTLQRGDAAVDVTLERRQNRPATVSARMLEAGVGYVRLTVFGATSGAEVQAALDRLKAHGAKGLIFDLRNNGGGYIRAAQEICSLFLPAGKVIMSVVGRNGRRQNLVSKGPGAYHFDPMVILVNGFSASASEATAGCLRDQDVAMLIGSQTFGKGSMQSPVMLPDQAMLKLTVGRWYSPSGTIIDKAGLTPSIEVPQAVFGERSQGDVQLQKAEELVKGMLTMPH